MAQPKPVSGQKHKTWKVENTGKAALSDRDQMLHQVNKASAKGKAIDHDSAEDDTAPEADQEGLGYAAGGHVKCMHCGGHTPGYDDGGGVMGSVGKMLPMLAMLNKGGKVKGKK